MGLPYELLVVCNHDLWEAPAGRALNSVLTSDIPGLPQPEASFRISQTSPAAFSHIFKPYRNIIDVQIDPTRYTQSKFKYTRDKYASPQMVLTIQSPNATEFQEFVEKNEQTIIDFFTSAEMNRELDNLKKGHNRAFLDSIQKKFDCDMHIPTSLTAIKSRDNFLWASDMNNASKETIMNIVVYSFPYTDKKTFTLEYFLNKRDSVMKVNIPGGPKGSYMTTQRNYVYVKDATVHGKYAQVARGLWRVQGDRMGGPFVSHSRVDEVNGRVIVAEAFVYAPETLKRDLIRRMEAALYTVQLPKEPEVNNLSYNLEEIIIEPNIK